MNLKELLTEGKKKINNENEDSVIILKILIEHVFKIKKEQIIVSYEKELNDGDVQIFFSFISKLNSGVPIQYITNRQEFMKLNFYVDENVLIPQPDTEILVEEVIKYYKNKQCQALDLCTGSGAIGISIAKYIDNSRVIASDISSKALQIAKLNAEKNLVHKKMQFIESDLFANIEERKFDIIVSNPPYIKTEEIKKLDKQVQNEPHIALDGGNDGLFFYKIIADNAYKFLNKSGKLFLEIGFDQKDDVIKLLQSANVYKNIYSKKDLANNDRIIVAEI